MRLKSGHRHVGEAGASLNLSATFGVPPADVTAVDVHIPRFGIFNDVPIS